MRRSPRSKISSALIDLGERRRLHVDARITPSEFVRVGSPQANGRGTGVSRLLTETFEENILTRLVALNHERTAEEKRGLVRWLRPEYQCPTAANAAPVGEQTDFLPVAEAATLPTAAPSSTTTLPWPDKLPEQVARVRSLVPETGPDPAALSARFGRPNKKRQEQIEGILETLRGLGL